MIAVAFCAFERFWFPRKTRNSETAFWCLFPIYAHFLTSLKKPVDVAVPPPKFAFSPFAQNCIAALPDPSASTTFALGPTMVVLVIGIPTACVLACYRFRGNADFGFWIRTTPMTPPVTVLIPLFVMFVKTGLLGTNLWGSLCAAVILMLITVLALVALFQRQVIRGLTMGTIE